jgi:hypothetical protein
VVKLVTYGDQLVLINFVVTSLPMCMISFLEIPKGVRKRLGFFRSRFASKVVIIESIECLDGTPYADQKIRGGHGGSRY